MYFYLYDLLDIDRTYEPMDTRIDAKNILDGMYIESIEYITYNVIYFMAFTRFYDDIGRIQKRVDNSSFSGKYALATPGPGDQLPYLSDPQWRLQYWGGNLRTNTIGLENDLFGLTRKLNRDLIDYNDYTKSAAPSQSVYYPENVEALVDESRATHPAWMYRDAVEPRWETPFLDPQANVEIQFPNNIQSRILEKDYFVRNTRR